MPTRMPARLIFGAVMLLVATASFQWADAADQIPEPQAETATGALAPAGVARAWGFDGSGQLGNGAPNTNETEPVAVSGLTSVVQMAGGFNHTLALLSDGTVMAWGENDSGQLGNGAAPGDQLEPVVVSGLGGVEAIAAGTLHSLALLSDGTVRAWGRDVEGQLGNGAIAGNQDEPVVVSGLTEVDAIAAGSIHSLALLEDDTVRAWGGDSDGQLGNGVITGDQTEPVVVNGLTAVDAIAAGNNHSLALINDGTVRAWGSDSDGQLGNGAVAGDQDEPVVVSGLTSVEAIASGGFHALALRNDGTVRAWGRDDEAQLGNGSNTGDQLEPVVVSSLGGVEAIAAGSFHSLALLNDSTIRAWGLDGNGQLGNGATTGNQPEPFEVSDLSGVAAIAAGNFHSLAIVATCLGQLATIVGASVGETINGTPGDDVIVGGGGDDTINGLGGNDIICGGDGDDTVTGGPGDDEIDGGDGNDTARFPGAAVTVNLAAGTAVSGADGDTLASIENASGSTGNDKLTGNGLANRLEGLQGNDVVNGGGGNDTLLGGDGNDTADGGAGEDTFNGGGGVDTIKYPGGVGRNINLITGTVSGEGSGRRLTAVENVKGSNGPDVIKGNGKANRLEGNKGNDTLRGNDGNDKLFGGGGTDTCDGGAGADSADGACETKKNIP